MNSSFIDQCDDLDPSPAGPPGPYFCVRCREPRQPSDGPMKAVCAFCGDLLVTQGYCPVCEDFWPLQVGTPCPKHELALEPRPKPQAQVQPDGAEFRWHTVGRYVDSQAAQAPRIRLEDEGIPTFIEGERMGSLSMYGVATGGAKLKVPEQLADEARIILSQTWSATAAALDIEDEFDDEPASADATDEEFPAKVMALASSLTLLVVIGLPILTVIYYVFQWMAAKD